MAGLVFALTPPKCYIAGMKTLTITISDEAAKALDQAVAGGKHTAEEVAAHVVETTYAPDWGDLDDEDVAAIEAGLADIESGNVVAHEHVVAEARAKYGW